jgi:hypothetical protein
MPYRVEQAIFTSQRGERMAGYQLTSRSPGIDDETAVQLTNWGPAHDALETRLARTSVNVHPLGDDRICLSYTQLAGAEYSGRGGGRVYTSCFVVDRDALAGFQFNPFQILRAFRGAGRTQPRRDPPETLESFQLIGRTTTTRSPADSIRSMLDEAACEKLLWGLSAGQPVYLAGDEPLDARMEEALSLLRSEERAEISLSTALRISPRRPFQFQAIAADAVLIRQLQRNEHAVIVQLPSRSSSPTRDTKSVRATTVG